MPSSLLNMLWQVMQISLNKNNRLPSRYGFTEVMMIHERMCGIFSSVFRRANIANNPTILVCLFRLGKGFCLAPAPFLRGVFEDVTHPSRDKCYQSNFITLAFDIYFILLVNQWINWYYLLQKDTKWLYFLLNYSLL